MLKEGTPVQVIWNCKTVDDNGVKEPKGFKYALYNKLHGDELHSLYIYLENRVNPVVYDMYSYEFYPLDDNLKKEEFI